MEVNENGYWAKNNLKPCWELTRCSGILNNGNSCPAYNAGYELPCWQVAGTKCKGKTGRDIAACATCVVYRRYGDGEPITLYNVVPTQAGEGFIEPLDVGGVSLVRRIFRLFAFTAGLAAFGAGALAIDPALLHLATVQPSLPVGGALGAAGAVLVLVPVFGSVKDRKNRMAIEDISSGLARVNDFSLKPPGDVKSNTKDDSTQSQTEAVADPAPPENRVLGDNSQVGSVGVAETIANTSVSIGFTAGAAGAMVTPWTASDAGSSVKPDGHGDVAIDSGVVAVHDAAIQVVPEVLQETKNENAIVVNEAQPADEDRAGRESEPKAGDLGHIIGQTPPALTGGAVVHHLEAARQRLSPSTLSQGVWAGTMTGQTDPAMTSGGRAQLRYSPPAGQPATFSDVASLFELMNQAALTDRKLAANLADEYASIASSATGLAEDAVILAGKATQAMAAVQGVLTTAQELSTRASELSVKAALVAEDMDEAAQLRSSMTGDAAKAAVVASGHVHAMAENLKRLVAGMGFVGEGGAPTGFAGQNPALREVVFYNPPASHCGVASQSLMPMSSYNPPAGQYGPGAQSSSWQIQGEIRGTVEAVADGSGPETAVAGG